MQLTSLFRERRAHVRACIAACLPARAQPRTVTEHAPAARLATGADSPQRVPRSKLGVPALPDCGDVRLERGEHLVRLRAGSASGLGPGPGPGPGPRPGPGSGGQGRVKVGSGSGSGVRGRGEGEGEGDLADLGQHLGAPDALPGVVLEQRTRRLLQLRQPKVARRALDPVRVLVRLRLRLRVRVRVCVLSDEACGIGQTAWGRHWADGIGQTAWALGRTSCNDARMLAGVASSTAAILPTSASASLRKSPWNIWARGAGGAKARARRGLRVALGFGCGSDTKISSAKLLSSPSRALMASKSNTNCARQQAQCDWGRCSSHGSGRRELPRTCGSVASPLSSGAFSVVRTRPVGKTNKVVSRQARWLPAERRNRECSSHGRA